MKFILKYTCVNSQHEIAAPGVNFINVLRAEFASAEFESAKKADNLTVKRLLGSVHVKAAHRMLMKLTPEHTKRSFFGTILSW